MKERRRRKRNREEQDEIKKERETNSSSLFGLLVTTDHKAYCLLRLLTKLRVRILLILTVKCSMIE